MLALTGDDAFLVHVRERATSLGLFLNEFGLWRFHSNEKQGSTSSESQSSKSGHWELLPSESEEEILTQLALDWVEPEKRNFGFLENNKRPRYRRKI